MSDKLQLLRQYKGRSVRMQVLAARHVLITNKVSTLQQNGTSCVGKFHSPATRRTKSGSSDWETNACLVFHILDVACNLQIESLRWSQSGRIARIAREVQDTTSHAWILRKVARSSTGTWLNITLKLVNEDHRRLADPRAIRSVHECRENPSPNACMHNFYMQHHIFVVCVIWNKLTWGI